MYFMAVTSGLCVLKTLVNSTSLKTTAAVMIVHNSVDAVVFAHFHRCSSKDGYSVLGTSPELIQNDTSPSPSPARDLEPGVIIGLYRVCAGSQSMVLSC